MTSSSFAAPVGDRYQVGERLGRGGMSEVWAATDLRLGRPVAIKFLRADLDDPTARARIEAEARSAAKLSHPNIVNVFDAGEHEGRPFVVMELADARSLADVIREEASLPADRVRAIAAQVLAALATAHAQGIVHRDVKPANILVGEDDHVKLADFGIAKMITAGNANLTAVGQVMGTPTYLSPEQASGQGATPQSDLYALGVVLYEALTGRPPYTGDTPVAIVMAHAQAPVPDLAAAGVGVPPDLARTITRALAKSPDERFASAEEMARAVAGSPSDDTQATAASAAAGSTQATSVATTRRLGQAGSPAEPVAGARNPFPLVAGAAVALLFLLLVMLGLRGTGDTRQPAGASADASSMTTQTPETTVTEPEPAGESPRDLLGLLESDPEALGEKGPDLRKKLGELMGFDSEKRAKEARSLQQEIEKWVDDGELDAATGAAAIDYLDGVIAEAGRGDTGRGRDKGDEEKDDD
jgi:eukaryotic-like serine/threonine-protein kinase